MIGFIELRCFDLDALTSFRRKMLAVSSGHVHWVEWSPQTCERPELTIIGTQISGWRDLAAKANTAYGRQVVLHGDHPYTLGLQILRQEFDMNELLSFFSCEGVSICTDHLFESDVTGYKVPYKQTIPAPTYM